MKTLLPHSRALRTEIAGFAGFFVFLLLVSVALAGLRSEDRQYLHADSGISGKDLVSLQNRLSYPQRVWKFFVGIASGNPGKTVSGEDVYSHMLTRFLPTLHLALFAVFSASLFAVFFSLLGVYLQNEYFTGFFRFISNVILSTPVFVACVVLLLLFFSRWNLLPPGGYENLNTMYVILPGMALGMRVFARLYLFTNAEAFREYDSPYTMVLKTRGYGKSRIVMIHVSRKILPVILVYILLDFSSLMSGAMVAEEIFFFPGIGKSMFSAIRTMDENLLSALLFYTGMVFYIFNRIAVWMQNRLKGEA